MAFGCQMHQHIDRFLVQKTDNKFCVCDITFDETISCVIFYAILSSQIRSIRQLVEIYNTMRCVHNNMTADSRANKACASCDEKCFRTHVALRLNSSLLPLRAGPGAPSALLIRYLP